MTAILNLAFALLAGLLMTRIFSRWHLPDVTAFLVTGVLIGPFVLGRLGNAGKLGLKCRGLKLRQVGQGILDTQALAQFEHTG